MSKKKQGEAFEMLSRPVDPEKFLFVLGVMQAAASMSMPSGNPELHRFRVDGQGYHMADLPMNRGLMAVAGELKTLQIEWPDRMAYMNRLMQVGEIFGRQDLFGDLIKPGDEPDALLVDEALLKACAVARLIVTEERIVFDLDDLLRHARAFSNEERD